MLEECTGVDAGAVPVPVAPPPLRRRSGRLSLFYRKNHKQFCRPIAFVASVVHHIRSILIGISSFQPLRGLSVND
jgi:hypothetical protein